MFFCLFRFGSSEGPQPVSGQSFIEFNVPGHFIADFFPAAFFDALRVTCGLRLRRRERLRVWPSAIELETRRTRRVTTVRVRFMRHTPMDVRSFWTVREDCEKTGGVYRQNL